MIAFEYTSIIVFNLILVAQYSLTRETTTFYPCGLDLAGFVQFVKWQDATDNVWTASLNFSYYPHLTDALVEIKYQPLVTLKMVHDSCSITVTGNNFTGRLWKFKPENGLGKVYRFDVQTSAPYPYILTLKVNGYTACTTSPISSSTASPVNLNALQNNGGQTNTTLKIACGRKRANYVNLIFQGDESTSGQWPWHVAILYQKEKNGNKTYICGGSIIGTNTVLTAAHCVVRSGYPVDPRNVFLIAGETVLYRNTGNAQENQGKHIHVYPFYSGKPGTADIAVIKTLYCFVYNDYVQPVCIMRSGYNKNSLVDLYGTVVGFGFTENHTLSNVLRHTTVKIQSDTICLLSDVVYQQLINDFNFCAGNGPNSNANPCNGDSGGGLVIEYDFNGSKNWVVQGITSVAKSRPSTNQCDPTQYVVYTAVAAYTQWIMEHL